eukprot:snap_masked-scaffold56_size446035-processed-gene-3.18 protein:Tk11512 transcript:snap_masked-scaffold56_size446035-processed-gene-3.18-mRNA-1 annotation:"ubiquitin-like protein 5-like"
MSLTIRILSAVVLLTGFFMASMSPPRSLNALMVLFVAEIVLVQLLRFGVFIPPKTMIEITVNDRLGKKVRVKCNEDDTIGDLKKLIAAQTGTRWDKIVLKKWYTIYKDHISLEDYEIHDGMNLELYYQ